MARLWPEAGPMDSCVEARAQGISLIYDMVLGVYRMDVFSVVDDRSPYGFVGPQSGGSGAC